MHSPRLRSERRPVFQFTKRGNPISGTHHVSSAKRLHEARGYRFGQCSPVPEHQVKANSLPKHRAHIPPILLFT